MWCNPFSLLFACFAFNILISCLYILFVRLKNNYCFCVQEEGVMLIMIMMAIKRKTLKQQKNLAHASLRRPRHVVGSLGEKTERSRGTFHIISALLILTCLQKIKSHFNKHQRIYPSTLLSSHIILLKLYGFFITLKKCIRGKVLKRIRYTSNAWSSGM